MKVAILHDWIFDKFHPEFSLIELLKIFKSATIFTVGHNEHASILSEFTEQFQSMNIGKSRPQVWNYIHDFPGLIEKTQLEKFDLIISNTRGPMNWVKKTKWSQGDNYFHISYSHDSYADIYLGYDRPFGNFWSNFDEDDRLQHQKLDLEFMQGVDLLISSSKLAAKKLSRDYQRNSPVVYAPLPPQLWQTEQKPGEFFLAWGFYDQSKSLSTLIELFNHLPEKLVFIGEGDGKDDWKKKCSDNITLLSPMDWAELNWYLARSTGFITTEPFKIHMLPAVAAARGVPLISYKLAAGAEYIMEEESGIVYDENNIDSLASAFFKFQEQSWSAKKVQKILFTTRQISFKSALRDVFSKHLPDDILFANLTN
jgi:glycosyltransferase involved in cell wall biosynthesis